MCARDVFFGAYVTVYPHTGLPGWGVDCDHCGTVIADSRTRKVALAIGEKHAGTHAPTVVYGPEPDPHAIDFDEWDRHADRERLRRCPPLVTPQRKPFDIHAVIAAVVADFDRWEKERC